MGKPCFYSVYDRATDQPVMIHGTSEECARAMGVTVDSFQSFCSRQRLGRPNASAKWEIVKDEED